MASEEEVPRVPISTSEVDFHEATSAQRTEAWRLNGLSWAGPISVEDYVAREQHLSETDFTANELNRYWTVTRISNPDEIVASCETTQKTVYCGGNGGYREVRAYAIASVYTNPKYRRNGMAAFLLNGLKKWMDGEGASECSALYSDIGKEYYTKLGWIVYPSLQVTIGFKDNTSLPSFSATSTKALKNEDLPALCKCDIAESKRRIKAVESTETQHIAFEPSHAQAHWHFAREEFVAQKLFGREPEIKGAITEDGQTWVYWDHNFGEKKMNIQRIVHSKASEDTEKAIKDVVALLESAAAQTLEWELKKVVVWNPDDVVLRAAEQLGAKYQEGVEVTADERTDGSIPSLRWKYDQSLHDVVWDQNEYYAWC